MNSEIVLKYYLQSIFKSNIFKHLWLNNKDTFCLYHFIKILSSFLISVLVSGWNWFTKSCASVFREFIFFIAVYIYIYIYIYIIIIIMSRHQHGYFRPSPAIPPFCPLLPTGHQSYIRYRHRAAVCKFEQDVLPLLVHVKGSTRIHHLWARHYFSSRIPHDWFV